jgi:hypothetical protein
MNLVVVWTVHSELSAIVAAHCHGSGRRLGIALNFFWWGLAPLKHPVSLGSSVRIS